MGEKELVDLEGWFEHICQTGDEICEQAYQSEDEHYRVMEEEADQDREKVVAEIMETHNSPNEEQDRYLFHEYTNDLGGEPDPRWSEDDQLE